MHLLVCWQYTVLTVTCHADVQVLIDGIPLDKVDAHWYRSQIGVVAQDPRLFSTTIAANITYGCVNRTQVRAL